MCAQNKKGQDSVRNGKSTGQKLLSMVPSLLVTLVVLELAARLWIGYLTGEKQFLKYASLRQLHRRNDIQPRYTPHRYLGYYPTPNYVQGANRHNSLGYRSEEIAIPKPEGQFRIVCMGGSTTYTTEVDDYRMSYPSLLEKELKERRYSHVQVINAGAGSWTSWESLINFEFRLLDLEPDMIIVYDAVNDLLTRFVWPHEAYRGDNSGAISPPSMSMPSILEYSTLMRYVMIRTGLVKPHSSMDRHMAVRPKTYWAMEFHKQNVEKTYPSGIFREVTAEQMLAANPPVYFRRNIENLALVAKHRGVHTVLATFAYSPAFTELPLVTSPASRAALAEMNETLKSIAREMDVHLFDFAALFPADKRYYTDGVHVNVEGVKLKARLFADYLSNNRLIPAAQ